MDTKTLTRLRPIDDTAAALRASADRIDIEYAATEQHLAALTAARPLLTLQGTDAEIKAAEVQSADYERDLLRLAAMREALAGQHTAAVAAEAGARHADAVRAASDATLEFNAWLATEYLPLAEKVAEGLAKERRAWSLRRNLGTSPVGLEPIDRAYVGNDAKSLAFLVRLPAIQPCGDLPAWPGR